jgi:LPS export ABC transporter protein LptC/lipopolysaccharide transport protein LptA
MRLQRLFTHRLVRFLRAVLPLVVIALVAVPAWNYLTRRAEKSEAMRRGIQLPKDVSVHTEGFTFSRTEGGRTLFMVHAKSNLGFKDNKGILEDVDVTVYGSMENELPRTIRSKRATYDQATNDFQFNGNVEVQLDANTIVRTDELIYSQRDGTVVSPKPAQIEQLGTRGRADRVEYGLNTGLLKLAGNVKVDTAEHTELQTDSALFNQKENWTTMTGGVFIKSQNGWIRGTTGRADLVPQTYKAKMITLEGDVTGESRPAQPAPANDAWKLRAGWLEAAISPSGNAERVKTRSNVELDKIARDTQQRLTGGEIDAQLNDAGRVETVEARQNARMILGSDQTLESNVIRSDAAGSVQTFDTSVLKLGDSIIQGREFTIQNAEDIVTFSTMRRADMKSGDRLSSADRTNARFDGRTNMLIELVQTGNFQFRDPQYQGHAATARFENGGTIVTLEGSPVVTDAEKRLEGAQIRLNQKDNSFVATRNVNVLMKSSDGQLLVKSAHAEGNPESMLYTGNVQLWRGDAYIKADRLEALGKEKQNTRVHAEGKVQSILQAVRANSDKLDYDDTQGLAHYMGNVRAQKQDMILESPDVAVNFRDNNVTEMTATGGVRVTRADQRGTGERAVYDAATDIVTLTGKNAQARDKEHGLVQGARLIMKKNGETAAVESGNGERTVTQHPVQNKK